MARSRINNVITLDTVGNYRKTDRDQKPLSSDPAVVILEDEDEPQYDPKTGTTTLYDDKDVIVTFGPPPKEIKDTKFGDNLAEYLSSSELSIIAEKLLDGIYQDDQSRAEWLENMSTGISLLGLQIKNPRGGAASGTTPSEGVSTIDHPLLLEAVLRFQANARGELLPSDGPVKVRNDGEGNQLADKLADALEKDMNHYLTKTAKEYYPDTDRMLLQLGFCGISFKKGYHCPIKRRPVIASIDAKDLIVSNGATDIDGAGRVTHRILMRPSVLKRMQLLGAYVRDAVFPSIGIVPQKNVVDQKIDEIQGIVAPTYPDPEDQERELYECYCELDIPGFEHKHDGESSGLPLPYKVTLDREARKILEIRRNWAEDDEFCLPRNRIVAYTFIPGLGFYGIGLLNVLGNATKAVTASWRLMIDAGMFANFPGFLYLKSLAKQLTNQFRIAPGSGMPIDTVGADIRSSVMPLPYKDPSAVFIQLIDNITNQAQRVGGTAELQVGEGNQDAPVGTTLAMMEQAVKLMNAVHKRAHESQGQEFDMLKELLMEDPAALWRHNKKSKVLKALIAETGLQLYVDEKEQAEERHRELFLLALEDCELIPRADPNTSSQTERYLKVVALRQMAMSNQGLDLNKVDEQAMRTMGIDDPERFFVPPPPQDGMPPADQIIAMSSMIAAQARMLDAQTKAQQTQFTAKKGMSDLQLKAQMQQRDLTSRERIASLGVAKELVTHSENHKQAEGVAQRELLESDKGRQHEAGLAQSSQQHELGLAQLTQGHEKQKMLMDQQHQQKLGVLGHLASHATGVAGKQADLQKHQLQLGHQAQQAEQDRQAQLGQQQLQMGHEHNQGILDRQAEQQQHVTGLVHEHQQGMMDREHEKELETIRAKARAAQQQKKAAGMSGGKRKPKAKK